MKKLVLIIIVFVLIAVVKDTYFYVHKGLPSSYVCDCSSQITLLCNDNQLNVILDNDYLKINGSTYTYTSKGREASLINKASYKWSTINKSLGNIFEFHIDTLGRNATYKNEFGKEELSCRYIGNSNFD